MGSLRMSVMVGTRPAAPPSLGLVVKYCPLRSQTRSMPCLVGSLRNKLYVWSIQIRIDRMVGNATPAVAMSPRRKLCAISGHVRRVSTNTYMPKGIVPKSMNDLLETAPAMMRLEVRSVDLAIGASG